MRIEYSLSYNRLDLAMSLKRKYVPVKGVVIDSENINEGA